MGKLIEKQNKSDYEQVTGKIKDISVNMNWVFGFKTKNTRHPLYFIKTKN